MPDITPSTTIFSNLINNSPVLRGDDTTTKFMGDIAVNMSNHDNILKNNNDLLNNVAGAQNAMYTITIDENERLNRKKQNVDIALQGQNRMIDLNDSYVKRYAKYNQIVMVIVLVILIILGAILLPKFFPVFPSFVSDLVIAFTVSIGAIVIYLLYSSIQARDKLYFDKLDLSAPDMKDLSSNKLNANDGSSDLLWGSIVGCVGPDCCTEPAEYVNGKCVNPPSAIYDYSIDAKTNQVVGYKSCSITDPMACPAQAGETASVTKTKTWSFDSANGQWRNVFLNKYWDLTSKSALPIQILPDAPSVVAESFTNFQPKIKKVEPMQSSETSDYSFYK